MKSLIIAVVIIVIVGIFIECLDTTPKSKKRKHSKPKRQNSYKKSVTASKPIQRTEVPIYESKDTLLTETEKQFYLKLKSIYSKNFDVQCQINLASVIDKKNSTFRGELFRNIDFGIFDKQTLKPLVLIELNDSTHKQAERYRRDLQVRAILAKAKIPLVTFYADCENKETYIAYRINQYIEKEGTPWRPPEYC